MYELAQVPTSTRVLCKGGRTRMHAQGCAGTWVRRHMHVLQVRTRGCRSAHEHTQERAQTRAAPCPCCQPVLHLHVCASRYTNARARKHPHASLYAQARASTAQQHPLEQFGTRGGHPRGSPHPPRRALAAPLQRLGLFLIPSSPG